MTELRQFDQWVLTDEGLEVIRDGSHEARVYRAVDPQNGSLQADIMVCTCGHIVVAIEQLEFFLMLFSYTVKVVACQMCCINKHCCLLECTIYYKNSSLK